MKKILLCLAILSLLAASCGRSISSDNNAPSGSVAPTESNTSTPVPVTPTPSVSPEPTQTPSAPPAPTPEKASPDESAYLNESDIITPYEARVLTAADFGLKPDDLYWAGTDEKLGYTLEKRASAGNGFYVNQYNGDVRDKDKEIIFNVLEDQPVSRVMSRLDLKEIALKDESRLGKYLFSRLLKELGKGEWFNDNFMDLIRSGSGFNGRADFYTFNYESAGNMYYWLRTTGSNAESGKVDRITLLKNPGRYVLYAGKTELGITFDLGEDDDITHMDVNYQSGSETGSTGVYHNINAYGDPDMDSYINRWLYGLYEDNEGRVFKFTADRKAIWPDRSFNYSLYNTDRWEGCNPLAIVDGNGKETGEYFGYKKTGDQLYIYKAAYDKSSGYVGDEIPFLVLEKYSVDQNVSPLSMDDFTVLYNGVSINDTVPFDETADKLTIEIGKVDYENTDIYGGSQEGDWYIVHYPSAAKEDMEIEYAVNTKLKTKYLISIDLLNASTNRGIKAGDDLEDLLKAYGNCRFSGYNSKGTDFYYYTLDPNTDEMAQDKSICFIVDNKTFKISEIYINYNSNKAVAELDLSP